MVSWRALPLNVGDIPDMDYNTGVKRRVAQWGTLHQTNKAEHQSLALGGHLLHF